VLGEKVFKGCIPLHGEMQSLKSSTNVPRYIYINPFVLLCNYFSICLRGIFCL